MVAITNLLKNNALFAVNSVRLQEQIREKQNNLLAYKSFVQMNYDDFRELLSANAAEIMLQRSVTQKFVIDQHNGPVIRQLYLYFTNHPDCVWNLNAGLIFAGKVGCGKSILMMAYLRISDQYSRKLTTSIHAKTLAMMIKHSSVEEYSRRPLFIDELGREESELKDYGNVVKPVIDLFALRYENGARTYATTNFKYESFDKFYGEFIRSRMEEMMTYVPLTGESRRIKNEVRR